MSIRSYGHRDALCFLGWVCDQGRPRAARVAKKRRKRGSHSQLNLDRPRPHGTPTEAKIENKAAIETLTTFPVSPHQRAQLHAEDPVNCRNCSGRHRQTCLITQMATTDWDVSRDAPAADAVGRGFTQGLLCQLKFPDTSHSDAVWPRKRFGGSLCKFPGRPWQSIG